MLSALLFAHLIALALTALAGRSSMRRALLTAAAVPALTAVWALTQIGAATGDIVEVTWVERLDISLRFRVDNLALLMVTIVSGIGALVFVYASGYFGPKANASITFPVSLLGFSTSMLGLVLADSVWTLFIFWELTSVTSFLLVGHNNVDPATRAAARRALMITGGGGLALLAGLLVLVAETGSTSLTGLPPVSGTAGTVASLLVLAGVATKSAQVPFHVWLPGAMAAPTPVSAYLHSATMVKAGIVLMAVTGPAFVDSGSWKWVAFALGSASMLWGGVNALRHRDAKLILAWGTISQLGLLVLLLALGSPKAIFAAVSILVAHALFKATLFLVVGEVDIRTGTRNVDELGGLSRDMPIATAAAVLAGLSMAGAPPLLGFVAKEAAIEATLGQSGLTKVLALGVVTIGSILTVAYTVRFLWCTFGPGPATSVAPRRPAMTVAHATLGAAGLLAFFALSWLNPIIRSAAVELNPGADAYKLIAWPGLKLAFVISLGILAAGSALGLLLSRTTIAAPAARGARLTDQTLDAVLTGAKQLTARIQHGSLPVYVATMAVAMTVAAIVFSHDLQISHLILWDHPLQMVLALALAASAIAGAFVTSRLGAALTLGSVGIAMSGIFVVHGAPDLALTQLLIETIVVVGFVVGLGHLTREFPTAADAWHKTRVVISLLGGATVALALAAAGSNPTGAAPIASLAQESVDTGGGKNIVNVVLTDMRALDTLGEVVVLATVALGILALATASSPHEAPSSDDLERA